VEEGRAYRGDENTVLGRGRLALSSEGIRPANAPQKQNKDIAVGCLLEKPRRKKEGRGQHLWAKKTGPNQRTEGGINTLRWLIYEERSTQATRNRFQVTEKKKRTNLSPELAMVRDNGFKS